MASTTNSSDLSKGILFRETFTVNSRDRDGKKLPTCNVNKEGCDGCKACKVPHFQQYVVVVRSRFPFSLLHLSPYECVSIYGSMCVHRMRYFISNSPTKICLTIPPHSERKKDHVLRFFVSLIKSTHTRTQKQSIEIRMHM